MLTRTGQERGASAVFIASAMLLLIGAAAIATDVGAGFNERRQTQTAADVAVMSGALEASFLTSPNAVIAHEALRIARSNTRAQFGDTTDPADPIWVEMWRACQDPDKDASYVALPEPLGWSAVVTATPSTGSLDCISRNSSFLRVRMPDQAVDTTFANVIGVSELTTSAVAVALLQPGDASPPVVPYGISGATGPGEACFGTGPSGTAYPPCDGPSAGTFGTLLSEFFGDYYGTVDCGNPGATEIATQTALGVDHLIASWLNPDGLSVSKGDPWPGDLAVLGYTDTHRDACNNVGGVAQAVDSYPINTVRVDTGFPSNAMESGLVSNDMFYGQKSRLQQEGEHLSGGPAVPNTTRDVVKRRQGANNVVWELDNHGPWDYLLASASAVNSACDPTTYTAALDEIEKAERFNQCLAAYEANPSKPVIFDDYLDRSPRLVWTPQYWFTLPTSGLSWEPVHSFRMAFVAGTFYNCSAGGCDVVFYPDAHQNTELCDTSGGGCQVLSLDQFSAWVLPDTAVNERIRNSFPGGQTPFEPELFR
jgi:hypothetical protein